MVVRRISERITEWTMIQTYQRQYGWTPSSAGLGGYAAYDIGLHNFISLGC